MCTCKLTIAACVCLLMLTPSPQRLAAVQRDTSLDLAGSWVRVSDDAVKDAASAAQFGAVVDSFCGARCRILVEGATMTIIREEYTAFPRVVIRLDGSATENTISTPGGPVVLKTTAQHAGGRLEMTTILTAGETRSRQVLTISRVDDTLLVERHIQRRGGGVRRQTYARR
jgi:hypothetical protein